MERSVVYAMVAVMMGSVSGVDADGWWCRAVWYCFARTGPSLYDIPDGAKVSVAWLTEKRADALIMIEQKRVVADGRHLLTHQIRCWRNFRNETKRRRWARNMGPSRDEGPASAPEGEFGLLRPITNWPRAPHLLMVPEPHVHYTQ
uniref:Putative secreted peptide n=1 Tax=Anopheles braziliensis TaxID=58242 RepID=A0A2M3ZMY8_9DIPT